MIKELIKKTSLFKWYRARKEKEHQERMKVVKEAFKKEAIDVLKLYSDAMLSNGLVFWLDFGTLLGFYREHDFIKFDFDLDTATWYENRHYVKEALEKAGFERVRFYYIKNKEGIEECYKHRDYQTTIDVMYYLNDGESSYCYLFSPLVSMTKKRHLNKEQPSRVRKCTHSSIVPIVAQFKGINVYVPKDTNSYLAAHYGDSFMTPIPNFPVEGRPNLTEYTYEEMPACAFLKIGYM